MHLAGHVMSWTVSRCPRPRFKGCHTGNCKCGGLVCCTEHSACCRHDTMPPEELQLVLCDQLCADPTQWWDCIRSKPTYKYPDYWHNKSKIALWHDYRQKPGRVDSKVATLDAWSVKPAESASTALQRQGDFAAQGQLKVGMCRKLFEDGRIFEAADALNLLVQQGRHVGNNLFYRFLKWCILHKDLALGRRIHALTVKSGYEGDAFLATHLIGLYSSHGRVEDAMQVFSKVPTPDAYNWANIIFAYARHGEAAVAAEAIRLYRQMRETTTVQPDDRIYTAVVKACAVAGDLVAGREVHSHILASPRKPDRFVQAGLVDMYAKCGSLEDARRVFDRLSERTVVAWNAMLAGYAQKAMGQQALGLYRSMQQEGLCSPDSVTYTCLLQACASVGVGARHEGEELHAQMKEQGLQEDVVVGGSLVNMYAKCGSLEDAREVFDSLPARNVVAWNAILAGYVQQGISQEAFSLYRSMQQEGLCLPDSVTYVCLLQACARVGVAALLQGKQLHAEIQERRLQEDVVLGGSLVNMYAKCGSLEDARRVFDRLPARNVVAWNAMLAGYAQQGMGEEALNLYRSMKQEDLSPPSSVTYVCLLQACASVGGGALLQGKQLHAEIRAMGMQEDVVLGGSLVNMYVKCGSLKDARTMFEILPARNVVTWTAMIAGYVQQGRGEEALSLYRTMQQEGLSPPDSVTYVCLLQACASVGVEALIQGKQLHAQIERLRLQEDVVLGGSLVNMYAKCGRLEDAREVFDRLPARNVVACNAILTGYAQQGMGQEAINLFMSMQQEGLSPDSVTYVCLLQACASVAALPLGKQLHAQIQERGLQANPGVGAAVVNMYAKCGRMFDAQQTFDSLLDRTTETWNALIGGYSRQGNSQVVFDLLDKMRLEGTHPNDITFLCVLTVCSHVGLVHKGREYFEAMRTDYGISATLEHFTCMMDLLGRAGHLEDALQMAKTMPFPPNDVVWHTLLGACWKWKNVEIGQQAFEGAVSGDESDAASYVLMSNIYASVEMWKAAKEMQARRKKLKA